MTLECVEARQTYIILELNRERERKHEVRWLLRSRENEVRILWLDFKTNGRIRESNRTNSSELSFILELGGR